MLIIMSLRDSHPNH